MEKKKNKGSSFLVQGSILAIASIASRIIGLIYRVPMKHIIGAHGNDFYSTAFEVYNIMLLISSYSLPTAVSKFVSECRVRGDYKLIHKVFRVAMVLSLGSGIIASVIIFFGASYITAALKTPLAIYALLVLAPALIILSAMGVLRGLFQGMGTMMPTAFSQILEQVVNAGVSVGAAYVLYQRGMKVGAVLGHAEDYAAAYGAAGGTMGTTCGALAGFIFVFLLFLIFRHALKKMEKKQRKGSKQSALSLAFVLICTIVPVLLSTTIYNISGIVDQFIFKNLANMQHYDAGQISTWWGVFTGEYKVLVNVPLAIASAMAASTVPTLTGAFAAKDYKMARIKTYQVTKFVMVISIPCVVGIGVLASPIMQLLFADGSKLTANMLMAGCISVAFYALSTLSNGILQGINRMGEPVKNAIIALVLHVGFLVALMYFLKLHIYAVIYANAFYAFVMCILNARSIRRYLHYRQEILRTFIIPSIASLIMGAAVYGSYFGLMKLYPRNSIWTIVAILVGVVVYGVFLLLLKGLTPDEILAFPGGGRVLRLAEKMHLVKTQKSQTSE
ncbi:MAG: polysaccharide biosynthesis protein [Lachnospiraceae bacterium]|nr:polysaccharide biosynthesis protein [Lachnospiraceae bacterium]